MNYPELWQLVDVLGVPVVGGIIVWIWKLDGRVYEMRAALLSREEFLSQLRATRDDMRDQIQALQVEVQSMRRLLLSMARNRDVPSGDTL